MSRRFSILFCLLLVSCAATPAIDTGTCLPNGCLPDAIACYSKLAPTGASPRILYIWGQYGGEHAMTVFRFNGRPYAFDALRESRELPASINPDDALQVARFCYPVACRAEWQTPRK